MNQREVILNLAWRIDGPSDAKYLVSALLGYLVLLLFFRHFHIVRPAREVLNAHARAIRLRLRLEADLSRSEDLAALENALEGLRSNVEARPWSDPFLEPRREIGAWNSMHEIERQFVAFTIPAERVLECHDCCRAESGAQQPRRRSSGGAYRGFPERHIDGAQFGRTSRLR